MSRFFSAFFISALTLVYCQSPVSSSNETTKSLGSGYFVYDSVKYNLDNMFMTGYTAGVDSLKFEVYLMESPIQDTDSLMTHTANTAVFWFYSPITTYLDTGKYTLVDSVSRKPLTISGAFCGIDYSFSTTLRKNEPHDFKTLTATVKRTNNVYTIDFDGVLVNYKTVQGHYEGNFVSF